MITVCITASAWGCCKDKSGDLIQKILRESNDRTVSIVLDMVTVSREKKAERGQNESGIREIDFREWVNETITEGGVLKVETVRRQAQSFRTGDVVVINANGFPTEIIAKALMQIRLGMYTVVEWPQCVVVICDDAQLFQISPILTHAFYIRPSILAKTAIARQVRRMALEARMLRLFGSGVGGIPRFIRRYVNWFAAREEKVVNKKLGWVWEE